MIRESDVFLSVLGALVAGLIMGILVGVCIGAEGLGALEKEAVKRGFAEYALLGGGPDTKFQWKEPKP